MATKFEKNRIFVLNEPNAPRLNPALAKEIGLNESLLLLQIEFWIAISDHERDGGRWTYQSLRDIHQMFTFWSESTINRTLLSLEEQHLVIFGNYNEYKYDRTRWIALDMDGLRKLKSIALVSTLCHFDTGVYQDGTAPCQDGTALFQNETRSSQNETTIPETTTETTTETTRDKAFSLFLEHLSDQLDAKAYRVHVKPLRMLPASNGVLRLAGASTWLRERSAGALIRAAKVAGFGGVEFCDD
jgi:hypothetical protein